MEEGGGGGGGRLQSSSSSARGIDTTMTRNRIFFLHPPRHWCQFLLLLPHPAQSDSQVLRLRLARKENVLVVSAEPPSLSPMTALTLCKDITITFGFHSPPHPPGQHYISHTREREKKKNLQCEEEQKHFFPRSFSLFWVEVTQRVTEKKREREREFRLQIRRPTSNFPEKKEA